MASGPAHQVNSYDAWTRLPGYLERGRGERSQAIVFERSLLITARRILDLQASNLRRKNRHDTPEGLGRQTPTVPPTREAKTERIEIYDKEPKTFS